MPKQSALLKPVHDLELKTVINFCLYKKYGSRKSFIQNIAYRAYIPLQWSSHKAFNSSLDAFFITANKSEIQIGILYKVVFEFRKLYHSFMTTDELSRYSEK